MPTPDQEAFGPSRPIGGRRTQTKRGLRARRTSHPRPRRSSTPTELFSTSTSDRSTSRSTASSPSGRRRSTVQLSLLRAWADHIDCLFQGRPLVSSFGYPPSGPAAASVDGSGRGRIPRVAGGKIQGLSILMTSAPRSARCMVQAGPAQTTVRSSTRTPWSGSSGSVTNAGPADRGGRSTGPSARDSTGPSTRDSATPARISGPCWSSRGAAAGGRQAPARRNGDPGWRIAPATG